MSRYYNDELYHHGIKGQKWGVRRFQNSNGTLTSAGKQRRASLGGSVRRGAAGLAGFQASTHGVRARAYEKIGGPGKVMAKAHRGAEQDYRKTADHFNKTASVADAKASSRSGLSGGQKTALKVGAAVAVAGLAAYGGHKILGGQHNATRAALQATINSGKKATQAALSKAGTKTLSVAKNAGSKVVTEAKNSIKATPGKAWNAAKTGANKVVTEAKNSIKAAPGKAWNAAKTGANKGAQDVAKVIASGVTIYTAQKILERRYGKEKADKIIQYGRQPFKKK